jgi:hypothetical protein
MRARKKAASYIRIHGYIGDEDRHHRYLLRYVI